MTGVDLFAAYCQVMVEHHARMLRRRLWVIDWALDHYDARENVMVN